MELASTSLETVSSWSGGGEFEASPQHQLLCVAELKRWVQNHEKFHGRSDDEFLLLFLRGCKFNLPKTKKKLNLYYESRRKIPRWWANRNLTNDNIMSLLHLKITTALIDKDPNMPTIVISSNENVGTNLGHFDDYMTLHSILMDTIMRRRNCQMNGAIWVVNSENYKPWLVARLMIPLNIRNIVHSFLYAIPVRIKAVICLNSAPITIALHKLVRPFLSKKLAKRFRLYGSDWSDMYDHVPIELLPEEFGGKAGPMKQHEDAFMKEVLAFNDYILEDNSYGFRK